MNFQLIIERVTRLITNKVTVVKRQGIIGKHEYWAEVGYLHVLDYNGSNE